MAKILVIEDDLVQRRKLVEEAKNVNLGIEILEASSGIKAMEIVKDLY